MLTVRMSKDRGSVFRRDETFDHGIVIVEKFEMRLRINGSVGFRKKKVPFLGFSELFRPGSFSRADTFSILASVFPCSLV